MHKAWRSIEEMPYCFSRSSIKFQGHTGWKINDMNPILDKITRPVAAIKSIRFTLFIINRINCALIHREFFDVHIESTETPLQNLLGPHHMKITDSFRGLSANIVPLFIHNLMLFSVLPLHIQYQILTGVRCSWTLKPTQCPWIWLLAWSGPVSIYGWSRS